MKIKEVWDNNDFENMNWHGSAIYSIALPQNNQLLSFDIDYIFEWILNNKTNLFHFKISPCNLIFKSVLDLKINLDFHDSIGISIDEIKRENPKISPYGNAIFWTYIILTDKGDISFTSTGFEQIFRKQPYLSESINIGRD